MANDELVERELSNTIIGAFYDSYFKLGFGFLESIYTKALMIELTKRGLRFEREVGVEVVYDGVRLGWYRVDLIVEGRVIIENKSSVEPPPHSKRQLLNYLACSGLPLGLLLHYGPKPRFYRVVNTRRAFGRQS